ncbi:hypothetical protein Q3G72_032047 [Acer saccharum]|nr:hypothetical protein Q3G72_032047 [Acer saccharum]
MRESDRETNPCFRDNKGNDGRRDFRTNLVSVFVGNLNPIVDQKGLWGIFKAFGLVRDIHLSPKLRNRRSCYAFVQFAMVDEAIRVARITNGLDWEEKYSESYSGPGKCMKNKDGNEVAANEGAAKSSNQRMTHQMMGDKPSLHNGNDREEEAFKEICIGKKARVAGNVKNHKGKEKEVEIGFRLSKQCVDRPAVLNGSLENTKGGGTSVMKRAYVEPNSGANFEELDDETCSSSLGNSGSHVSATQFTSANEATVHSNLEVSGKKRKSLKTGSKVFSSSKSHGMVTRNNRIRDQSSEGLIPKENQIIRNWRLEKEIAKVRPR